MAPIGTVDSPVTGVAPEDLKRVIGHIKGGIALRFAP